MIKEISREEFIKRFPEVNTYGIEFPVFLENGVVLSDSEWTGEYFNVKDGMNYRPISIPDEYCDDGEVFSWKTIGYEEFC